MNDKLKSYFVANNLKYQNNFGLLYNILFSIRGKAIISVYYIANYENFVSFILRRMLKKRYHFEVGTSVRIGKNLVLHHPYNIIIDSNVQIGDDCQIDQNVTIGGNMKKIKNNKGIIQTRPIIHDKVILCSGCLVAGPIVINNNCIIGANTTITFDVEEGSVITNTCKISSKKILVDNGSYQIIN